MRNHLSANQFHAWQKTRKRFIIGFFSIMVPFFILVLVVLRILFRLGIRIPFAMGPTIFTLIIAVLCLLLGFWVSYFLMDTIFRPIEKLSEASLQVAKGNYDVQIPYSGREQEIQIAIDNFNYMARELNSVEMMRNDFISNVSHEFKTPLTSIMGYVTLLQDEDLTPEERDEYIDMAFLNIEKLNDLTTDILQLSRLEHQSNRPAVEAYDLDEQIRESILMLEPKWSSRNIEMDIDLEEITYTGYRSWLLLVWNNLIGNAIKFTGDGGCIHIRLLHTESRIRFQIRDEGIGMDEETMHHIFEKFYQGDSSRQAQGNGLGLALCKKIIDLSQGYIFVQSRPGEGTTFTVELIENVQ